MTGARWVEETLDRHEKDLLLAAGRGYTRALDDLREALRSDDALNVVGAALDQHTRTGESGLTVGCTCGRWDLLVMDWAWHLAEVALAVLRDENPARPDNPVAEGGPIVLAGDDQ